MTTLHTRALAVAVCALLATGALAADNAHAGPFDGKIITSNKRIPTSAKSKQAYFAKLRKQRASEFWENQERKEWKIHFVAFFKRPLSDLEVNIKLYDVTERGTRQLKAAFEQYLNSRGLTSLTSYLTLEREKFGVNRRILMVIESRGRPVAQGTFKLRGEAEKFSGQVDFTEKSADNE